MEAPRRWTWDEFTALPRTTVRCDIHCVTQWSRFDNSFEGVACREVLGHVTPRHGAGYVMVHSYGGYTTNLSLDALLDDDTLFAVAHDGVPLTPEHGGPCRLVVPKRYFWKSAKWVHGIELMQQDRPGFWEQNGYHMHADPWKEERFSDPWG